MKHALVLDILDSLYCGNNSIVNGRKFDKAVKV